MEKNRVTKTKKNENHAQTLPESIKCFQLIPESEGIVPDNVFISLVKI